MTMEVKLFDLIVGFLFYSFFVTEQIVTLGMPNVSPTERVGKYVKPREWNALISDPDVVSNLQYYFSLSVTFHIRYILKLQHLWISDTEIILNPKLSELDCICELMYD